MNRTFAGIILFLFFFTAASLEAQNQKRVLFISSYSPSFLTFYDQVDGLRSAFQGKKVLLDVEFMDTKRFPEKENIDRFSRYLDYKLDRIPPYDLIITGDDNAFNFALDKKNGRFKHIPLVFLGVNNVDKALEMDSVPDVTGVIEQVSMKATIELIRKQNPHVRNVAAIVDGTLSGQGDFETLVKQKGNFPDLNFTEIDLRKLTWDEFSRKLRELDDSTAVLLLSAYFDKSGEVLDFHQSLDIIMSSLKVPAYHLWKHGVGEGLVGGKLVSLYEQGKKAGEIALCILGGENPADIPVVRESPNRYIVDYNAMHRFKIPLSTLPPDTIILNDPSSFLRQYSRLFIITASFILLLMLALAGLLFNLYKVRQRDASLKKEVEHNALLTSAIEQFDDTLEIFDRNRRLLYVNSAFLKLHGFTRKETEGKTPEELFTDATEDNLRISKDLWDSASKGETGRNRIINRQADGSNLIQDVTISPVYGPAGDITCFISVKKDITDFYTLLKDRNEIREKLFQAQKLESVGQLASGIAHDFNNILSAIMSAAQILLHPSLKPDKTTVKYGEIISSSCQRGSDIVERLLNYSRSTKSTAEPTDINHLVEEIIEVLRLTIKKDIQFLMDNRLENPKIVCVASSLQNALLNLGINSGHAIKEHGTIAFSLTERDLDRNYCSCSSYKIAPGRYCAIEVFDTGSGIAGENITRIFEPFYSSRKTEQGTGLGLSSVKRIIEEHGGSIELTSQEGEWTRFILLIPLKRAFQ